MERHGSMHVVNAREVGGAAGKASPLSRRLSREEAGGGGKRIGSDEVETAARKFWSRTCYTCDHTKHIARDCTDKECRGKGHRAGECPENDSTRVCPDRRPDYARATNPANEAESGRSVT